MERLTSTMDRQPAAAFDPHNVEVVESFIAEFARLLEQHKDEEPESTPPQPRVLPVLRYLTVSKINGNYRIAMDYEYKYGIKPPIAYKP